jgi:predicted nucleotidyltransferase
MPRDILTPSEVLALSTEILASRHPSADAAFVAGSFLRGQGTPTSDIDLVVLHPALPNAYRESFLFRDIPIETFVHDPETLTWFLDHDCQDGHPALISMLVEGTVIGPRQQSALALQQQAAQLFAAGPPPLTPEALDRLRYAITDKLDDLAISRSPSEQIAIGAPLYLLLIELLLRGNGQWNGSGKWTARLLEQLNPALALQCQAAFQSLYTASNPQPVLDLADTLLSPHGSRLFAGYRSDAPATWRSPYKT